MLRRRELVRVHAGVYVDHTGPLTAAQMQWVAVLACWPAALSHQTVIATCAEGPVHVAVAHHRKVSAPDGVVVHRMADFDQRVRWNASPPSVRFEHAVIDVACSQAGRGWDLPRHRRRRPVLGGPLSPSFARRSALVPACGVGPCCSTSSTISRREPARCSNVGISSWSEGTGCPRASSEVTRQRPATPRVRCRATRTCATRSTALSSSWTVAPSTTTPPPGIATRPGTWTTR